MIKCKAWWLEYDNLYLLTEDDQIICCKNPYKISIRYEGLDYSNSDSVTLVGNNKTWKKNENV